jgi:hypothetical protein
MAIIEIAETHRGELKLGEEPPRRLQHWGGLTPLPVPAVAGSYRIPIDRGERA